MKIVWLIIFVVLVIIAGAIIDLISTINNGVWGLLGGIGVKPVPGFHPDADMAWTMFVGVVASMVIILFALIVARSIREKGGVTGW